MPQSGIRRVLLTGDTVGGVWTFTLELAEGLVTEGLDVCLVTFGGTTSASQKQEAAQINGLRWVARESKLEWMDDPWSDVELAGKWLLDVEKAFNPDLIHLNTLCHGGLPWHAPVVTTVHSCVASWWAAVKGESLPPEWDRYRREVQRSLECADILVAPSRAALTTVKEHYGLNLDHARAIPNGRSLRRFRAAPKEPFILAAGRLWDEGKNIQALAATEDKLPWPVYLAGDPLSPNGDTAPIAECHLLGKLSAADLCNWYGRAAIYALPARYEPFGYSALEAALSGCCLVLGDIPSLREIWKDAAVYVPPEEPEVLLATLRRVIEDPDERERMAVSAMARAQQFTQARMTEEYLAAYEWAHDRAAKRRHACAS